MGTPGEPASTTTISTSAYRMAMMSGSVHCEFSSSLGSKKTDRRRDRISDSRIAQMTMPEPGDGGVKHAPGARVTETARD
jgi:hypothetical protein